MCDGKARPTICGIGEVLGHELVYVVVVAVVYDVYLARPPYVGCGSINFTRTEKVGVLLRKDPGPGRHLSLTDKPCGLGVARAPSDLKVPAVSAWQRICAQPELT